MSTDDEADLNVTPAQQAQIDDYMRAQLQRWHADFPYDAFFAQFVS